MALEFKHADNQLGYYLQLAQELSDARDCLAQAEILHYGGKRQTAHGLRLVEARIVAERGKDLGPNETTRSRNLAVEVHKQFPEVTLIAEDYQRAFIKHLGGYIHDLEAITKQAANWENDGPGWILDEATRLTFERLFSFDFETGMADAYPEWTAYRKQLEQEAGISTNGTAKAVE